MKSRIAEIAALLILCTVLAAMILGCTAENRKTSLFATPPDDGKTVVVIDPGHGFSDVGCTSDYITGYEKDITLSFAKELKAAFEKENCTVVLTHNGEAFPSNDQIIKEAKKYSVPLSDFQFEENDFFGKLERAAWENILDKKYTVDMFVSVHINSIENHPEISGASVDYCVDNPYSEMLNAFCLMLNENLAEISDSLRIFADEKDDAYAVTRYATCPSVLIETGYATNKSDAEKLQSSDFRKKFCRAVVKSYFDSLTKTYTGDTISK